MKITAAMRVKVPGGKGQFVGVIAPVRGRRKSPREKKMVDAVIEMERARGLEASTKVNAGVKSAAKSVAKGAKGVAKGAKKAVGAVVSVSRLPWRKDQSGYFGSP